jgi:hypothetical protein
MFTKRVKENISLEEVQSATVARLTDEDEEGKSPYQKALDNVVKNAALDCEQPVFDKFGNALLKDDGTPLTVKCPKTAMASAKSLDSIARLMGLPKKAVEEKFDIKIVNVNIPEDVMATIMARQGNTLKEERVIYPAQPSFVDAEVVSTNARTETIPTVVQQKPAKALYKQPVSVAWLLSKNKAVLDKMSTGVAVSTFISKAKTETLRIRQSGEIMSGHSVCLSAWCSGFPEVTAEVLCD